MGRYIDDRLTDKLTNSPKEGRAEEYRDIERGTEEGEGGCLARQTSIAASQLRL